MDYVCTENASVLEILPDGHSFASKPYLGMVLKFSVPRLSRCEMEIDILDNSRREWEYI